MIAVADDVIHNLLIKRIATFAILKCNNIRVGYHYCQEARDCINVLCSTSGLNRTTVIRLVMYEIRRVSNLKIQVPIFDYGIERPELAKRVTVKSLHRVMFKLMGW